MLLLTRAINPWLSTRGEAFAELIRDEFAALPTIPQ
jgi:hypothetical protein